MLAEDTKNNTNPSLTADEQNNIWTAQFLKFCKWDKDPRYKEHYEETVRSFFAEFFYENKPTTKSISTAITKKIAEIDKILNNDLNEIIHHPEFQELEASWRGLHQFVKATKPDKNFKIRLLDVTKEEILLDSECSADFDTTGLFKLFYENEYGTYGGEPYGLIVGNYNSQKAMKTSNA